MDLRRAGQKIRNGEHMTKNEPSETVKRVSTGVTLAALLFLFWGLRGWPARIAHAVSALMIWEMYDAFAHKNWRPVAWPGGAAPTYFFMGFRLPRAGPALMAGLGAVILKATADLNCRPVFPFLYPDVHVPDVPVAGSGAPVLGYRLRPVLPDPGRQRPGRYRSGCAMAKGGRAPSYPKKSVEGAVAGMAAPCSSPSCPWPWPPSRAFPCPGSLPCGISPAWGSWGASLPPWGT